MSEGKFLYEEESQVDRLARKSKETPIFPIAIGVCVMAISYGAYMFKYRGKMSPSVYLMHLRVGAQGCAVAALQTGLIYTMIDKYILNRNKKR